MDDLVPFLPREEFDRFAQRVEKALLTVYPEWLSYTVSGEGNIAYRSRPLFRVPAPKPGQNEEMAVLLSNEAVVVRFTAQHKVFLPQDADTEATFLAHALTYIAEMLDERVVVGYFRQDDDKDNKDNGSVATTPEDIEEIVKIVRRQWPTQSIHVRSWRGTYDRDIPPAMPEKAIDKR